MALVILALKVYLVGVIFILLVYAVRHAYFTTNRIGGTQRNYVQDIVDSDLPSLTVLICASSSRSCSSWRGSSSCSIFAFR